MKIAEAFNNTVRGETLSAPVVLGGDHHHHHHHHHHHDSETDLPYRDTSNNYDGSQFIADMAKQNVIGDHFRGATWISIHNARGVGSGEVVNGGLEMTLDDSADADRSLKSMLFGDVNNSIVRRSWARNDEAVFAIKREMERNPKLKVTFPNIVDENLLDKYFKKSYEII